MPAHGVQGKQEATERTEKIVFQTITFYTGLHLLIVDRPKSSYKGRETS
jgi:hypothetical protein